MRSSRCVAYCKHAPAENEPGEMPCIVTGYVGHYEPSRGLHHATTPEDAVYCAPTRRWLAREAVAGPVEHR